MGPTTTILLPYHPSESDIAGLDEIARSLGKSNTSSADFHVEDTRPIGGTTKAGRGGRPFAASFEDPELETTELEMIRNEFGFFPLAAIGISAICNDHVDHQILGELAAHFSKHFGGIVDFGGALPGEHPRAGRLLRIPYEVEGRKLFFHVGDLPFMLAWLRDPYFRMVK